MSKGKTISEPVAIPEEPGEGNMQTLLLDQEKYDYVKVEDIIPGLKGPHTMDVKKYRTMGYRVVPIQNRDTVDIMLKTAARTVYDGRGNPVGVPEILEPLHAGLTLMAREKNVGDEERRRLEIRNNPEPIDVDDVRFGDLTSRDGVVAREKRSVTLNDLDGALPSEADIRKADEDVSRARERVRGRDPGFEQSVVEKAMSDDKLAD